MSKVAFGAARILNEDSIGRSERIEKLIDIKLSSISLIFTIALKQGASQAADLPQMSGAKLSEIVQASGYV